MFPKNEVDRLTDFMSKRSINQSDLARNLGYTRSMISRMFTRRELTDRFKWLFTVKYSYNEAVEIFNELRQ